MSKMNSKGNILKKRIKLSGYTQSEFADACGISLSALKKYITDELPYSITLLEKFAELLECSTDYLLGRSETPVQELRDLKELTHLSDAAIQMLTVENADYCREVKDGDDEIRKSNAEKDLTAISLFLEDDELVYLIQQLLFFDEDDAYFGDNSFNASEFVTVGDIVLYADQVKGMLAMNIIDRLSVMREEFSRMEDKHEVLTREVSEDAKERTRQWLDS